MSPVLIGVLMIVLGALGFATWKAPRLTSVTVWALIAALTLTATLLLTLPFDFGAVALWLALAMPLLWVCFQFLCYWGKRGWWVATSLIFTSILCTGVIITTPPPT